MTKLDMHEIVEVLKAPGFNPSFSDVQKKLRELLPKDYAKEWKSFRPPKGQPISTRLARLRTKKEDEKSFVADQEIGIMMGARPLPRDSYQVFEGPTTAFRDYSDPQNDMSMRTQPSRPSVLGAEPESQLVVPSRLLLDGSTVASASASNIAYESSYFAPPAQHQTSDLIAPRPRSSLLSLRNLQERLRRSSSLVQSIHSVLRFSSTDSWRSNLSMRSSILPVTSFLQMSELAGSLVFLCSSSTPTPREENALQTSNQIQLRPKRQSPPIEISVSHTKPPLSEKEEQVWDFLMEDDTPPGPFVSRPEFEGMCFERRACCHRLPAECGGGVCPGCGMCEEHRIVRSSPGLILPNFINQKDYFDNTPLHFAAAPPGWDAETITTLIDAGADIGSVNTSGATFLHVLFTHLSAEQIPQCLELLRYLVSLGFDLGRRDYHGRTAFHMLFDNPDFFPGALPPHQRRGFGGLITMAPDRTALDNLGKPIYRLLGNEDDGNFILTDAGETTFVDSLAIGFAFVVTSWIEWLSITNRHTFVDTKGDTALIALIKAWDYQRDETELPTIIEKMVQSGTVVHMRDRAGHTAIAIAAKRGLRPAVTALIRLGACVNCRNYVGVSIFQGARRELRRAIREMDDKLYAMILSCILTLDHNGAVKHPDGYQEWAAAQNPLAKPRTSFAQFYSQRNHSWESLGSMVIE